MAKRSGKIPKWKRFEQLVALIERLLIGVNAKVAADDRIRDRYGNERQVDVSVRIDTGTTELLIIFECRNRDKVEDVTWVEQVYSKKDNLRADRAILVPNKPMSAPAQEMARDKGIELRSLREIEKSLLPSMFPDRMEFKSVRWHSEGLTVYPITNHHDDALRAALQAAILADDQTVFLEFPDGQTFNFREVCQETIAALPIPSLAPNVSRHEQHVEAFPSSLTARVRFGDHEIEISRATVLAVAIAESIEPTHSFFGDYTGDSKHVDHLVAQHGIDHAGEPINFSAVGKRDENKFLVNIPYGFMDENIRQGVDPERGVTLEVAMDDSGMPTLKRVD